MSDTQVTVSIVTFNHAPSIAAALDSVLAQTHKDLDLVVVDNASNDGTRDVLMGYGGRIRVILMEANTGFCSAHNEAIRTSESAFVLVMNPDVVLEPDFVERALAAMRSDPRIGTVAALLLTKDPGGRAVIDSTGLTFGRNRRFFLHHFHEPVEAAPAQRTEVFGCDGCVAFYRRAMIDDIAAEGEFFDEWYFAFKEVFDVSWRSQLAAWKTVFDPACRAFHAHGFKPGDLRLRASLPAAYRFHSVKNDLIHLAKNETWRSLLPDLPWIIARQAAILAYVCFQERDSLAAYGWFLKHRRALRDRRKLFARQWRNKPEELRAWLSVRSEVNC